MSSQDIIEIQDEPPAFHKGDWIGTGRQYPKAEAPLALTYYLASLLQVPDTVAEEYIPSRNLSIANFIQKKLPRVSYSLSTTKPEFCFRKEDPNEGTNALVTHELPSMAWVNGLKEHFGQAVLDGMESIEDPRYRGSRVPLWWIGFWTEMHRVCDIQRNWTKAMEWIENYSRKEPRGLEGDFLKRAKAILDKSSINFDGTSSLKFLVPMVIKHLPSVLHHSSPMTR